MIRTKHRVLGLIVVVFCGTLFPPTAVSYVPAQLVEGLVNIRFSQDVRIFTVTAAINIAGFDLDAAQLEPESARRIVRESIASIDPDLRTRLRDFYQARLKDGNVLAQQANYISYALCLKGPPGFELDLDPEDLLTDVQPLVGFEALLREFWQKANVAQLWERVRPLYVQEASIYRPLIRSMIIDTLAYLRAQARVSLDRRVTFIPNLLNAYGMVNARNISKNYFLVVGPSERGVEPMEAVRHEYLHFLLDPLVDKYRGYMPEPEPFLMQARNQTGAIDPFVENFPLMVSESLIRMVEIRLNEARGLEESSLVIEEYDRGLILAPYFNEALLEFEKSEEELEEFVPKLIKSISWDAEKTREASIGEMRRALALHREQISRQEEEREKRLQDIRNLLSSANDLMIQQNFSAAEELLDQVLLLDESNPSALFGLAQIAGRRQELDIALNLYARAAVSAGGETWIAGWSHLRRGNIFRLRGEMERARSEWSRVLELEGDLHGARQEAEKSLSQKEP